ncbi:MAG: peptide ABC transporter substrate-binding protein [Proteobacteria bacterium]|nr:peptide ABC transporter substrate-binding protein [Pseudomonadota bacterium]
MRWGRVIWGVAFWALPVFAKTLNLHVADPPVTLDWNGQSTTTEAPILNLIGEGLFRFEPETGKIQPALAESVAKSKDLKLYTFTIRKDAKWSDGRQVTAQDFVDSWLRLLSPQSTSLYLFYLFDIEGAREFHRTPNLAASSVGITAVDDRVLKVRLAHPMANWEQIPTFWPMFPVRKDILERFGDHAWRPGSLLSSGPFVYDSIEPGKKITLKRNKHYTRARTNIDQIDIHFDQDLNRSYEKYRSGFYRFIQAVPYEKIARHKGKDLRQPRMLRNYVLLANAKKFPMSNRDFRTAVMRSIDPSVLNRGREMVFSPARSLVPGALSGMDETVVEKQDRKEAQKALKASGVLVSKGLKLRILTRMEEPTGSFGKIIQEQIQESLGIDVDDITHSRSDCMRHAFVEGCRHCHRPTVWQSVYGPLHRGEESWC